MENELSKLVFIVKKYERTNERIFLYRIIADNDLSSTFVSAGL